MMIKNLALYFIILLSSFAFCIFYYAWFSWFFFLLVLCIPIVSLIISLPFMINSAVSGFNIFCNEEFEIGDKITIGVTYGNKVHILCPRMKVKLVCINSFANKSKRIKIMHCGKFKEPKYFEIKKLGEDCGCLNFSIKWCRVYDFLGIFFFPAKINKQFKTYVIPLAEQPDKMPEFENTTVLGYKPKSGGGFSEYYELRPYQSGDSLKNIHWKLSSKQDRLIAKEPSLPITKQLLINTVLSDNTKVNNSITARFLYVCKYLDEQKTECIAFADYTDNFSEIKNYNDALCFLKLTLFEKIPYNTVQADRSNAVIYKITNDFEEVQNI